MLGSIIGAAGSVALSAYQAHANNKSYDENSSNLKRYENDQAARYARLRNADITQLADNRAALTEGMNTLRKNNQAAIGNKAVRGGTNASVAAEKERNNRTYAQMIRDISANGQRYKENLDNNYAKTQADILNRKNSISANQLAGRTAAINTANKAFGYAARAIDEGESAFFDWSAKNSNDKENDD